MFKLYASKFVYQSTSTLTHATLMKTDLNRNFYNHIILWGNMIGFCTYFMILTDIVYMPVVHV